MKNQQIKYTREEKIAYFAKIVARLELAKEDIQNKLAYYKKKLAHVQSDEYQEWDSGLEEDLKGRR